MLVAGRYVVAALAWISTVIITRELTQEQWGEYSVVFALLGIVGFIADLRLSRIVLRDVIDAAEDEARAARVVGSYTGLRLVIGVVSYAVAMAAVGIGAWTGDFSRQVVLGTALGGLNLIILSVAFGYILMFEARLWLRDVAVSNVLGQMGSFALTVSVTLAGIGTLLWYVGANVVSGLIVLLWLFVTMRRGAPVRISFERSEWGRWLREAAPLALGAALDTIYFRIDILMLSIMDSAAAAGIYNVGYKFSDLLGAVPLAVMTPALTFMVAAWPQDPGAFRRTFRHTFVLLLTGAVGACVTFVVFADDLIGVLYPKYRVGADAARLLVVGQGLHFLTLLAFTALVAVKRNRLYPIAMLLGVVVNIGLNLWLIPRHSFLGSGWATVVTEACVLVALGVGVLRIPGIGRLPLAAVGKTAIAGVLAAVTGVATLDRAHWSVGMGATIAVYLVAVHRLAPNGPGGLRAFAGEPTDGTVAAAIDEGIDRPDLGTGLPD